MLVVVADTGYAQSHQLPQILVIYLSYGDIVLTPKPRGNRLHYSPFILKRLTLRKMKFYPANTSIHFFRTTYR
jgi:hypothetical protein